MSSTKSGPECRNGAVVYTSGFNIDADGAYRGYHPISEKGIDRLANAGSPGHWFGVVVGQNGEPVTQGPTDPYPGYYISSTSLQDHSKALTDPHRYLDSETIPYIAIAKDLLTAGLHIGDLAMVCYNGQRHAAICGDVGPAHKYGEGSVYLAKQLGIPADPRKGGCESGVTYIIFTGSASSPAWPRALDNIIDTAESLYQTYLQNNP